MLGEGRKNKSLKRIIKDWMLIICMVVGACGYIIYHSIPELHPAGPLLERVCKTVQPVMLFIMLFLSFCKIEPHQMKPHKWMVPLLLIQTGIFALLAGVLVIWPSIGFRVGIETAMLCLICPTATACAVVTGKLGGDMAGVVTYTILINLAVAFVVPLVVPLIYPVADMTFWTAFSKILAKVLPLLIMPCLLAWLVRYLMPKFHALILKAPNLAFYIWSISLSLAILMSTRAIYGYGNSLIALVEIAVVSLVSCIFQFMAGKFIGGLYGKGRVNRVTAGQALGQKNTVFSIWLAYTFMDPIVSVAGGFYSIWHNVFNSWQLYRKRLES